MKLPVIISYDDIIRQLEEMPDPANFEILCYKLGAETEALKRSLKVLALHDIAECRIVAGNYFINRQARFNDVLRHGSFERYLNELAASHKREKERSDLELELKRKQVQDLDIRLAYIEKQFKEQSEFWETSKHNSTLAVRVSAVAILVSLIALIVNLLIK